MHSALDAFLKSLSWGPTKSSAATPVPTLIPSLAETLQPFSSTLRVGKQRAHANHAQASHFPSSSLSTAVSEDLWFPPYLLFGGLSSPTKALLIIEL